MPEVDIHLYFHAGLTVSSWFSLAVQTDCDCQGHSGYFYAIHKHPVNIIRREGLNNYLCFPSLCLCGCLYISGWFLLALSNSTWPQSIIQPPTEHWRTWRGKK